MKSTIVLVIVLLIATTLAIAQSPRDWSKHHVVVEFDSQVVAEWTYIGTSDEQMPYETRLLYEHTSGDLLVVRTLLDTPNEIQSSTYEYLPTGEVLSFVNDSGTLTVTLGPEQLVMTYDELVAYSGEQGTEFPPDVETDASALIASASEGFRTALQRLSYVGCEQTPELYSVAIMPGHMFFDTVDCVTPTRVDYAQRPFAIVEDFDPFLQQPDAFEQQFGQAYYE